MGGSRVCKCPALSSSSHNLHGSPLPKPNQKPVGKGAWYSDLYREGSQVTKRVEKSSGWIWREKLMLSIHPSFCISESWAGTSEFTSTSNPALVRPMRITLCMFYARLFNFNSQ